MDAAVRASDERHVGEELERMAEEEQKRAGPARPRGERSRVVPGSVTASAKAMRDLMEMLGGQAQWAAFAVTGLIASPVIPLGGGPDMYLAPLSYFGEDTAFGKALGQSFDSFGLRADLDVTYSHPKVLLVPLSEASDLAVKNALLVSDMALAFFNKKYFSAKARFLNWDRRIGVAVGAHGNKKRGWTPILKPAQMLGPAIVKPIKKNFWDWLLAAYLRGKLPELADRLVKCLEWERESAFTPHITHRFAFLWIGLESMMPISECDQGALVRRYSLVAFAPRGADSRKIRENPAMRALLEQHPNPYGRKWVKAIEEMYRYRCAILHEGSTDLNSIEITPRKLSWFCHLAKHLLTRVEGLAINALVDQETDVGVLWSDYVLRYLYSDRNHWLKNGTLLGSHLIEFDWEKADYPEPV